MKNKKIMKIVIIVAILSLFIIPATWALYRTSINANSTLALATWNVSLVQTGVNDHLTIVPNGATATYAVNVKSLSEVNVKYDIVISNLPTGVEVKFGDEQNYRQASNGTITISNAGTILYTDETKTKTHTLTFRAVNGATIINNQEVDIDVVIQQTL